MLFHSKIKYTKDKDTGRLVCVDPHMHSIQVYNSMKSLVFRCANKDGMVETELLRSLSDQVSLRTEMLMTAQKYMDVNLGFTREKVVTNALFALSVTNPNAV